MSLEGYRVARRNDGDHAGSWGFYSDARNRWLDLVYPTEREATETMKAVGAKPRTRQVR
jgi:Mg2+ and Co2+ transporter CorA